MNKKEAGCKAKCSCDRKETERAVYTGRDDIFTSDCNDCVMTQLLYLKIISHTMSNK